MPGGLGELWQPPRSTARCPFRSLLLHNHSLPSILGSSLLALSRDKSPSLTRCPSRAKHCRNPTDQLGNAELGSPSPFL